MNNNDWFIMMNMSKVLALLLPFMLISALFRSCGEIFDPSSIESPQQEWQKIKNDLKGFRK